MAEYHINYSCDTEQEGSKTNISRIQRIMKNGGAELITKSDDDFGGAISIIFHYVGSYGEIKKLCDEVLNSINNSAAYVAVSAYEHHPKVIISTKNINDKVVFNEFIDELSKSNHSTEVIACSNSSNLLEVSFHTSKDSRNFLNEYTAKAAKYMKNGIEGVEIQPDWEDISIIDKNNRPDNRKSTFTF